MFALMETASSIGVTTTLGSEAKVGGGIPCLFFDPNIPLPLNDALFHFAFLMLGYLLICTFWYFVYMYRTSKGLGSRQERNKRILVSILIFSFMIYSKIVKVFFQLFSCSKFDGDNKQRLQGALDVICYSSEHLKWILWVGLPLGVVLLLLPVMAVRKIYFMHKEELLTSSESLETYGYIILCFIFNRLFVIFTKEIFEYII